MAWNRTSPWVYCFQYRWRCFELHKYSCQFNATPWYIQRNCVLRSMDHVSPGYCKSPVTLNVPAFVVVADVAHGTFGVEWWPGVLNVGTGVGSVVCYTVRKPHHPEDKQIFKSIGTYCMRRNQFGNRSLPEVQHLNCQTQPGCSFYVGFRWMFSPQVHCLVVSKYIIHSQTQHLDKLRRYVRSWWISKSMK